MIALRLPAFRLNHALAAGVIAFAGVAVWPWLVPPLPATRPLAAPQGGAAAPALTALPAIGTYAAVVERPLFAPSRRAPAGVSSMSPPIESRYRLVGVFATGAKRKAYVTEGTRRTEIVEGDTLDGWTVKQIGQDRVLLVSAAGQASLKLARITAPEAAKSP
jgi:hypothetical protein